jgi:hypothetical protein
VSLLVCLAFGAAAIAPAFESLTWQFVVYAVLSLMVIRTAQSPSRSPVSGSAGQPPRSWAGSAAGAGIGRLRAAGV